MAHPNALVSKIVGVVQIAEAPRAGKHKSPEQSQEREVLIELDMAEVEESPAHSRHVAGSAHSEGYVNHAEYDDDDHDGNAAFHGYVDPFRTEEDGCNDKEDQRRPDPVGTGTIHAENEVLESGSCSTCPTGKKSADKKQ